MKRPWYRETSSAEENERARQAYRALMTLTLLKPDSPEYRTFTEEVRARALRDYDFSYRDSEIFSVPSFMHFLKINNKCVTGVVRIDANGDRNADYSLLDMNPITGDFEVNSSGDFV
ncbi:unnamed protein product [Trichobilharzia regenti]|nr:unnamed protein product [Trichobilharzia regenti]